MIGCVEDTSIGYNDGEVFSVDLVHHVLGRQMRKEVRHPYRC